MAAPDILSSIIYVFCLTISVKKLMISMRGSSRKSIKTACAKAGHDVKGTMTLLKGGNNTSRNPNRTPLRVTILARFPPHYNAM